MILRIDSPDLHDLNERLKWLPRKDDDFPFYQAHTTIAYLKRGAGKKYKNLVTGLEGVSLEFNVLKFSDLDGGKTDIKLEKSFKDHLIQKSLDSIQESSKVRLVVNPNKLRNLLLRLKKARTGEKLFPFKFNNSIEWVKAVPEGLVAKGKQADKGDDILVKSGLIAKVVAVGRDGVLTKDGSGNKYKVLHKDIQVIVRKNKSF